MAHFMGWSPRRNYDFRAVVIVRSGAERDPDSAWGVHPHCVRVPGSHLFLHHLPATVRLYEPEDLWLDLSDCGSVASGQYALANTPSVRVSSTSADERVLLYADFQPEPDFQYPAADWCDYPFYPGAAVGLECTSHKSDRWLTMSSETSEWITLLQWAIGNPEKGALALVLVMGAWKWIRELRKELKEDQQHESFTETLLRENKELRAENKELVHDLREARSQRNLKDQNNGKGDPK